MPIAYRIEHPESLRGPYVGGGPAYHDRAQRGPHGAYQGRPAPCGWFGSVSHPGSPGYCVSNKEVFGFESWKQLRGWFHVSELAYMIRRGWRIRRFEVPKFTYRSRYQVAFVRDEAKEVTL